MYRNQKQEARKGSNIGLVDALGMILNRAQASADFLGLEHYGEVSDVSPRYLANLLHEQLGEAHSILNNWHDSQQFQAMESAGKLLLMFELEPEEGGGAFYKQKGDNLCLPDWFFVRDGIARRLTPPELDELCDDLGVDLPAEPRQSKGVHNETH